MLHSNPDCERQYKDLPYSGKYPSHGSQKQGITHEVKYALIGARENEFL
jgi:hypothetical protein